MGWAVWDWGTEALEGGGVLSHLEEDATFPNVNLGVLCSVTWPPSGTALLVHVTGARELLGL